MCLEALIKLTHKGRKTFFLCVFASQSSEDGGRRLKRREKNRVAAQKSRKRQTQRADLLHEVCVCVCVGTLLYFHLCKDQLYTLRVGMFYLFLTASSGSLRVSVV